MCTWTDGEWLVKWPAWADSWFAHTWSPAEHEVSMQTSQCLLAIYQNSNAFNITQIPVRVICAAHSLGQRREQHEFCGGLQNASLTHSVVHKGTL